VGFFSIPSIGGRPGAYHTYSLLRDIMTMEYVGWGNADGNGNSSTVCQHGPVECLALRHFACAKYNTAGGDKPLDYVECFDHTLITTFPQGLPPGTVNASFAAKVLQSCASSVGVDWSTVHMCASTSVGDALFAKEKAKTPAHSGVPFVTLNDGPVILNSATLNLVKSVCEAYTGVKPAACASELATPAQPPPAAYTVLPTPI